ncbi:MAG: hypothetical protein EBQ80_02410 [Proteobacteria bacterium]|nr:hypothetical protein [Pseudomonadota bacterium]
MLQQLTARLPWLSLSIMAMRSATLVVKFALSLFIAHRLGMADLGAYGLVVATSVLLPVALALGIMQYLTRPLVTQPLTQVVKLIRNSWELFLLFYAILLPFTVLAGWWFGQLELALLTLAIALFEHANTDSVNTLTNRQRPLAANISFFIRGALWVIILVPLGYLFPALHSLHAILYGWLCASIFSLIIFFILTKKWPWHLLFRQIPNHTWYRQTLGKSWTFYISEIGNTTGPLLDRYIITLFLGLEATGVYVLFWSVTNALMNLVITGSMQIRRPQLIQAAHQKKHAQYLKIFKQVSLQSLGLAVILSITAAAAFPWVAQALNRPEVLHALPVLFIMLAGSCLRIAGDLVAHTLYAYQKDKSFTFINFLALPISLAANLALVPFYGLYGAAMAAIFTQFIQLGLRWWRLQPILDIMRKSS